MTHLRRKREKRGKVGCAASLAERRARRRTMSADNGSQAPQPIHEDERSTQCSTPT